MSDNETASPAPAESEGKKSSSDEHTFASSGEIASAADLSIDPSFVQLSGCDPGRLCWAKIPVSPGKLTTVTVEASGGEQRFIMALEIPNPPPPPAPNLKKIEDRNFTNQKVDVISTTFPSTIWFLTCHHSPPGAAAAWTANTFTVIPPTPGFALYRIFYADGLGGGCNIYVSV